MEVGRGREWESGRVEEWELEKGRERGGIVNAADVGETK